MQSSRSTGERGDGWWLKRQCSQSMTMQCYCLSESEGPPAVAGTHNGVGLFNSARLMGFVVFLSLI